MIRSILIISFLITLLPLNISLANKAGEEVERTDESIEKAETIVERPFTVYAPFPMDEVQAYLISFSSYTGLERGKLRWVQVSEEVLRVLLRDSVGNFKGDIILGYSSGFLSLAKDTGFLSSYRPYTRVETYERLGDGEGYWSAIYFDLIGFATDPEILAEDATMSPPRSWWDLIKPKWKGRVGMPSPEHSEAGLRIVATLIGLMGEENAFEYLRRLNLNIESYAYTESYLVSGIERDKGVVIASSATLLSGQGLVVTYPREGSSFEAAGLGILKGTPHLGLAQEFVNWALSERAGALYSSFDSTRIIPSESSHQQAEIPLSTSLSYDRWKIRADRLRLINRWRREVLRQGKNE